MKYFYALRKLYPDIYGYSCTDISSASAVIETLRGWPEGLPLPTVQELERAA